MVYAQPGIRPGKRNSKILWVFAIHTDHLIMAWRPDIVVVNNNNNNKKRTCRKVDFTVLADHRVKLKEGKKRDKYLDLAGELKKNYETLRGLEDNIKKNAKKDELQRPETIQPKNKATMIWKQKWEEKQLNGFSKTRTCLRKRNLKRETESLPIAAQKNVAQSAGAV